jgi:hypothetical protein
MATNGRSGLARAVVGSVTDRVIRESPVPVVAIHPSLPSGVAWPGDDASAEALIQLFQRGDVLSAQAFRALTDRGPSVVPDLVEAAHSSDVETRQFAVRTLGAIKDERALPVLVQRLKDGNPEVRWEAAEAVIPLGEAGVREVLRLAIHERSDQWLYSAVLHVLRSAPVRLRHIVKPVIQAARSLERAVTMPIAAERAVEALDRPIPEHLVKHEVGMSPEPLAPEHDPVQHILKMYAHRRGSH